MWSNYLFQWVRNYIIWTEFNRINETRMDYKVIITLSIDNATVCNIDTEVDKDDTRDTSKVLATPQPFILLWRTVTTSTREFVLDQDNLKRIKVCVCVEKNSKDRVCPEPYLRNCVSPTLSLIWLPSVSGAHWTSSGSLLSPVCAPPTPLAPVAVDEEKNSRNPVY